MTWNPVSNECGGTMQKGYVAETAVRLGIPFDASYWIEGKPEKSKWTGLKTKGKTIHYILAYRCEQCGFLKFFAGPATSEINK
jgi:Domain of unknown function (DUF6487)